ncbi:MAG TPA: hypothetical protein VM409_07235 [Chloroflexia bacterium]|nr:hypothetical protein [Chloroflexia bacterium]
MNYSVFTLEQMARDIQLDRRQEARTEQRISNARAAQRRARKQASAR